MYMTREKIFENRREVVGKICQDIRANNGQMLNAKYFFRATVLRWRDAVQI